MEPEVQPKQGKRGKKNTILVLLLIFSLLMLAAAAQLTYMTLNSDRVYKGVYLDNLNVGGLSKAELTVLLDKDFKNKAGGAGIELKTDRVSVKSSFTDLNVSYDIDKAVAEAYDVGRTGNIFERLGQIISAGTGKTTLDMPLSYDKDKLNAFVDDFYNKTLITVKEAETLIQDDKVILRSGKHGENIDKTAVLAKAEDMIKNCTGGTIDAEVKITQPTKLDVDNLYADINKEPQDATFKVENGDVVVVPHAMGVKVDKGTLENIAQQLESTENTEKEVPVEFTAPKLTTEAAKAGLFKDTLGKMSTYFSTGNQNGKNRGTNISLAASKISGKILLPGETFSFNDTVGPRSAEGGYQEAHTYVAGQVIDGIGGGICQVSSTLYNAVLKADLGIVERRNHMFTVGYVPYGQDATVSYGTTDFRFQNTTNWPVKIIGGVRGSTVSFTLIGTNETPDKSVIITNKTIETIPFTTKYTDDPTLPEGTTKVTMAGENGYVIDTYKTIKMGSKVISQAKLYTSKYKALTQEVLKGTKKGSGTVNPPTSGVKPNDTNPPAGGVDDADNPPAPADNADDADNPPAAQ